MNAKEQSKATTTTDEHPRIIMRRYRDDLKSRLESLDTYAESIVADLQLEAQLLPRNAYIGAPGTYARHVYNTLAGR